MSIVHKYETIMVFTMKDGEEFATSLAEKFKSLIEGNGTIESVDVWGKRRLAYLIDNQAEGYYVLVNFQSAPEFIAEQDRIFKITEGVLRHITIKRG